MYILVYMYVCVGIRVCLYYVSMCVWISVCLYIIVHVRLRVAAIRLARETQTRSEFVLVVKSVHREIEERSMGRSRDSY